MKDIKNLALPIGAGATLAVTLWLALSDRIQAATLTAGLTVALILLSYLPSFESWKGWGVEAKWRKQITEADDLLGRLRRLGVVAASQSIRQLSMQGRWDGISLQDKRALAEEFGDLLTEMGVAQAEIVEAKKPLVAVAGMDLYLTIRSVVQSRQSQLSEEIRKKQSAIFPGAIEGSSAEYPRWQALHAQAQSLRILENHQGLLDEPTAQKFDQTCQELLDACGLPESDKQRVRSFAKEIRSKFLFMLKEGNITPDVVILLKRTEDRESSLLSSVFEGEPLLPQRVPETLTISKSAPLAG